MVSFIKELWALVNSPNNDQTIIGLFVACFAIISMHFRAHFVYKKLIKAKDEEIKRLVSEKNKLQDILLRSYNGNRQSAKSLKDKSDVFTGGN